MVFIPGSRSEDVIAARGRRGCHVIDRIRLQASKVGKWISIYCAVAQIEFRLVDYRIAGDAADIESQEELQP